MKAFLIVFMVMAFIDLNCTLFLWGKSYGQQRIKVSQIFDKVILFAMILWAAYLIGQ
jgi:hypothetical protein